MRGTSILAERLYTGLIPSSRDHGTRPRFIEKAATSQYSQNAAHPAAKAISTAHTCQLQNLPKGAR